MDAALPPLIQRMLQPDFYPHPVQTPVRLVQTHISYVFLTGDFAYKVKKATRFGFLDFTTLERRAYFCQEELRLNRRLSPDLYLAVLPIYQGNNFYLNAPPHPQAEIVDYALQMRQFPQDGLFSHLLQSGQLSSDHLQRLGQLVAQFHVTATTDPTIEANGTPEAISIVDEDNYTLAKDYIGQSLTLAQWQQTRTFTQQFWHDHQDWLYQRLAHGKIRECHGDLHLNNVCLYQEQIHIFDCIEFCREFRNIDVIYDIAFMVMDLDFHHRPDLANIFLNTYLENTGDYEGALLLPAYLSMRATIRGNVNSMTAKTTAISSSPAKSVAPSEQTSIWQQARAYFRLASQYAQPQPGQIVIMSGLSGSGKSTVARRLACQLNGIHIRSDAVRKHLAGISLTQSGEGEQDIYTPEMTQKTYQRLADLGLSLAKIGWTVILDAKYDQVALRAKVLTQAKLANIPVQILYCTAPMEVLRSRLHNRQGDISDATATLLINQRQNFQSFISSEKAKLTQLFTDQDLDAQLTTFCKQLAKIDNVRLL